MKISELARNCGVSTHALRHYERLGLLHPQRHANGYWDYSETMRREVVFIAMSHKPKKPSSTPFPQPHRKRNTP